MIIIEFKYIPLKPTKPVNKKIGKYDFFSINEHQCHYKFINIKIY